MTTKKLVMTALFSAIICVSTMVIMIPSSVGYIHMGDATVLLSAYLLGPLWGGIASGIGSCLSDVFSGYLVFSVPTLVIKFVVALASGFVFHRIRRKNFFALILCGMIGEVFMVFGYFLTEIWLTENVFTALTGIYGSLMQAGFGILVSALLYKVLSKNQYIMKNI